MINKEALTQIVEQQISGTDYFLVDVAVTADNRITVEIDSFGSVDIDFCATLSREIEANFDREAEDYELEVGSAGLTTPFKVFEQYRKNIGNEVEVLTKAGEKLTGILTSADKETFVLTVERLEKQEGSKRKAKVKKELSFKTAEIKHIKYLIRFK